MDIKPYIEQELAKQQKAMEESNQRMVSLRQQAEALMQQAQQVALEVLKHQGAVQSLQALLAQLELEAKKPPE